MVSAPSFLLHVMGDTELIMDVGQECSRYQAALDGEERRSDLQHGIHNVSHDMYVELMRQQWPRYNHGEVSDLWETLPIDKNPNTEAAGGYLVRSPQAPLLLRFYECSRDMEFKIGKTSEGLMAQAEAREGEVHLVHMSAWGHTRDSMCCVKVLKAGVYMAEVTMPSQYTCKRLCFRTYSNKVVQVAYFNWPKNIIVTNAGRPLDAIPYSFTGMPRIDDSNDRLPRMFDEDEGAGKKHAGPEWLWRLKEKMEPDWEESGKGQEERVKIIGLFGGADAEATMKEREVQAVSLESLVKGGGPDLKGVR